LEKIIPITESYLFNESSIAAVISHRVPNDIRDLIAAREPLVDSIGNLTLVTSSLNPSLGHEDFSEKKTKLAKSLLVLNREIAAHDQWNEESIRKRGIELAKCAASIWAL
jgi:hypothetical protein